ncbi:MAG: hypothetical protein ACK559_41710, partial [bacterium]
MAGAAQSGNRPFLRLHRRQGGVSDRTEACRRGGAHPRAGQPKMSRPNLKQSGIRDVAFGADVSVVEPCNLYGCKIGDGCFIGPFVEIQKDVVIGQRTKIQSHAFICELVTIGDDCFVSHGA